MADECVQVVRYPWYAASLLNCCPSWLTWLRSAFTSHCTDADTRVPGKHYIACMLPECYIACVTCKYCVARLTGVNWCKASA